MPKKHLVVAIVNDGSGFHLHFDTHDAEHPEVAAARFLAIQDLKRVAVYEFAVLDGVGAIEISPMRSRSGRRRSPARALWQKDPCR